MSMHPLPDFPYRVLIVDDDTSWSEPMKDAVAMVGREAGLTRCDVDVAGFADEARLLLALNHYHLVSLDLRIPERANEAVSIDTGLGLTKEFPNFGFPKLLIYSGNLDSPLTRSHGAHDTPLRIEADAYAKGSSSHLINRDSQALALGVLEWAQVVVDSLDPRERLLPARRDGESRWTMMGALLDKGPALLPPSIARAVVDIAAKWNAQSPDPALLDRLLQRTTQWAIAQGAVLCAADGLTPVFPATMTLPALVQALRAMQPHLRGWNWSRFLSDRVLDVFWAWSTRTSADSAQALRLLQHALDVSTYWIRHPVCVAPRYSRDGWTGQPIVGATPPRRRKLMPEAQDFTIAEGDRGAWQYVWKSTAGEPVPEVIRWASVLEADAAGEGGWWLRVLSHPQDDRLEIDAE